MEQQEIYIEQLMIEKLSGMINEKDSSYLDDLLESNEEIKSQWEKLKESFRSGEPHRYLQSLDENKAWLYLKEGIAEKKRSRTVRIRRLSIAASLMVPLIIAGIFFFSSKTIAPMAKALASDRSVKLYLNESNFINLSHALVGSVYASNTVKLNINNGSLSYTLLGNHVSQSLNTLVIPETASYKLTLSDSTEVWLNSMSQLKFPFAFQKNKREVWVTGEAYFKVAHNTRQPFIVHTPLTDIQVLGTEFNVNTYDSIQIKTALVKGMVNTRGANGKQVRLKPGYEAVFTQGQKFDVAAFDSNNKLSWMQGIYYFQNASLNDIAVVIHRWYGDTLIFDNSKVSSSRFTGAMFKNKPVKEFLDNLTLSSNISNRADNGVIHLTTPE